MNFLTPLAEALTGGDALLLFTVFAIAVVWTLGGIATTAIRLLAGRRSNKDPE